MEPDLLRIEQLKKLLAEAEENWSAMFRSPGPSGDGACYAWEGELANLERYIDSLQHELISMGAVV